MIIYDNIINFYKEYIKLEQIIRKGWIMRNIPVDRLESVADHTLQLLMLASVITKELNIDIDLKKLMEMLLIHDLGEIIIGDERYAGITSTERRQGAGKEIDIDCGAGKVEIQFLK